MTSFLTSLLSAITRRWTRTAGIGDVRLLGIVSNVPAVVWETRGERIDFISEHVTRMLGYTVEECMATPDFWLSIVHPDDRDAAAKQERTNAFRCMTKDGRTIWCEAHTTVILDEQGKPAGMRGVTLERAMAEASPEAVVAEEGKSAAPDFRRKRILVVHRDPAALESVAQLLRERGARVTTAKSAAEAILALLQHHDLIVTDIDVPVAEGVTLAQQLQQNTGSLPAIVLRKRVDAAELAADVAQALSR